MTMKADTTYDLSYERPLLIEASADDVDTGTVTVRVFLDDNIFANDRTRPSPVDLGAFPHQCLGNVTLCPNGFTLAFWYKPPPGANTQVINIP